MFAEVMKLGRSDTSDTKALSQMTSAVATGPPDLKYFVPDIKHKQSSFNMFCCISPVRTSEWTGCIDSIQRPAAAAPKNVSKPYHILWCPAVLKVAYDSVKSCFCVLGSCMWACRLSCASWLLRSLPSSSTLAPSLWWMMEYTQWMCDSNAQAPRF